MSNILPAATVVLVRDGERGLEVLMLERSQQVSFAEGLWVFPGGRIDREDYAGDEADIESAARRSAVRETQEEAQFVIGETELIYFAHWTTPPHSSRRYATWFFIAAAERGCDEIRVDGCEIVAHRWCRPADAVAEYSEKLIDMMPPTVVTLRELSGCDSAEQALAMYRDRCGQKVLPQFEWTVEGVVMRHALDPGYDLGAPDVEGPDHRSWILAEPWRSRTR